MTLQDIGSLGELIAAVATIGTLWYLARQIRQSSQLVRHTQSLEFVRWRTDLLAPLVNDRGTTELWLKGEEHFRELDDADRQRLVFFEWRAISGWSHYFHMHRQGLVEPHQWQELQGNFSRIGRRQAMRAAWQQVRDGYEADFRAFLDRHIEPLD